jgi:3-oxoacyl-[acyl-carrier protein] reductase
MDADLRGKTALITGGASGIGLAIARALAREGVDLAIASRTPEPRVLEELQDLGARVHAVSTDVRVENQVNAMVARAIEVFGRLDLYVNNAASTWHQPITQLTTEAWLDTINTNLTACLWACREVCRHMVARRQGSILIVGSTAQYNQAYQEAAYHITKTGLRVFKNTLALEMAPYGIRVNLLVPGHYPTKLTASLPEDKAVTLRHEIPLRRFGRPAEVGPAAVLLLSDALSSYTTGAELTIDGGLHLRPLPVYTDEEITLMNLG